jgi:membrane protein required for beta-lactamase induction
MDEKTTNKRKARDLWVVQGLKWFMSQVHFFFFSLQIGICIFGLFLGECKIMK